MKLFKIIGPIFIAIFIVALVAFVAYSNFAKPQTSKATSTWLTGWNYRKQITISKTNVNSTLAYFPLLVKIAESGGGDSNIGAHAQNTGYDIRFTSSDGTTVLPYERESFSVSNNNLTANIWVRIDSISSAANTDIYIYYGNSSATTDWTMATSTITNCTSITNAQCVWKEGSTQNFAGVWHMSDNTSNTTIISSTGNYNGINNANTNTKTTAGLVGNAINFNGTDDSMNVSPTQAFPWGQTVSFWLRPNITLQSGSGRKDMIAKIGGPYIIYGGTNGKLQYYTYNASGAEYNASVTTDLVAGNWYYFVGTYDAAHLYLYLNATQYSASVDMSSPYQDSGYIHLASSITGNGNSFDVNGVFDEYRISSTARSADWVKFEYYNQSSATNELTFGGQEATSIPFLSGWNYRKKITIPTTNVTSSLTNFPFYVRINADTSIGNYARADGYDIRFTSSDGQTLLSYERESWTGGGGTSATGNFWVKIPTISATAPTEIYIYYGSPTAADGQSATNVWDSNFKGVWHLPNGTTLTANDSTSNGNNGTITGTTAATGKVNGAGSFNGTNDVINIGDISAYNASTSFSFSAWVNRAGDSVSGSSGNIAGKYASATGWFLDLDDGSSVENLRFFVSGVSDNSLYSSTIINNSAWYYVEAVYDGVNKYIYVNGSSTSESTTGTPGTTTNPFKIGFNATGGGTNNYFNGSLDEVRISSTARSADWIKFEYCNMVASDSTCGGTNNYEQSYSNPEFKSGNAQSQTPPTAVLKTKSTIGAGASWLTGWNYRKKITISKTNVSSDLSYFPLLVKIAESGSGAKNIGALARSDGYDVRFTASDGTTILPHERESYSVTSSNLTANIWVRIPTIFTASDTVIYMYYGNSSATSDWTSDTSTLTDCTSITNAQCVWKEGATQSFKGIWHLKETGTGSTGDYKDSTSNANNSTNTTSQPTVTTSGKIGNGESFDGTNYIDTSQNIVIPTSGEVTLSMWVLLPNLSLGSTFVDRTTNTTALINMYSDATNIYWRIRDDNNNGQAIVTATNVLAYGNWVHAVGTRNSSGGMTLFVNGISKGTEITTTASLTAKLRLGRHATVSGDYPGSLDETRISNVARSADWVKFEYYNQSSATNELTFGNNESAPTQQGWLTGWSYRKKLTIYKRNVDASLSYFPLYVKISSDSKLSSALATGYDIRFTSSDGTTILPYERETWSGGGGSSATANLWVRVPSISSTADTTIYMYYGNSSANTDWTADTSTLTDCTSITNSQCVWKEGPTQSFKGVWHMKETGTNPTVNDSTSNANNSTSQTWTPTTSGKINGGATFSGGTITISDNASLKPTTDITCDMWLKPTSLSTWSYIFGHTGSGGNSGYMIYWVGGYLRFAAKDYITYYAQTSLSADSLWHHVVGTYSKSTGLVRIWIDGIEGTQSNMSSFDIPYGTDPVTMGNNSGWGAYYGSLDEIKLASTARSAEWIKFEYANQSSSSNEIGWGGQEAATSSAALHLKNAKYTIRLR